MAAPMSLHSVGGGHIGSCAAILDRPADQYGEVQIQPVLSKIFHPGLFHLCSRSAACSVAFQHSRLQSSDLTWALNQSQARPKQNGPAHSLSDPFLCRRKDVGVLGRLGLRDREMGSVCRQDAGSTLERMGIKRLEL